MYSEHERVRRGKKRIERLLEQCPCSKIQNMQSDDWRVDHGKKRIQKLREQYLEIQNIINQNSRPSQRHPAVASHVCNSSTRLVPFTHSNRFVPLTKSQILAQQRAAHEHARLVHNYKVLARQCGGYSDNCLPINRVSRLTLRRTRNQEHELTPLCRAVTPLPKL